MDREPGPGYLGVLVLAVAVLLIGRPNPNGDLVFWPLFLLLVGVAGVGLGLRPRRRLPPEPGPERTAPTTPLRPEGREGTTERETTRPARRLWQDEPERDEGSSD